MLKFRNFCNLKVIKEPYYKSVTILCFISIGFTSDFTFVDLQSFYGVAFIINARNMINDITNFHCIKELVLNRVVLTLEKDETFPTQLVPEYFQVEFAINILVLCFAGDLLNTVVCQYKLQKMFGIVVNVDIYLLLKNIHLNFTYCR